MNKASKRRENRYTDPIEQSFIDVASVVLENVDVEITAVNAYGFMLLFECSVIRLRDGRSIDSQTGVAGSSRYSSELVAIKFAAIHSHADLWRMDYLSNQHLDEVFDAARKIASLAQESDAIESVELEDFLKFHTREETSSDAGL